MGNIIQMQLVICAKIASRLEVGTLVHHHHRRQLAVSKWKQPGKEERKQQNWEGEERRKTTRAKIFYHYSYYT